MSDETTSKLVERVREALERLACDGPVTQAEYVGPADGALAELQHRLERAEAERDAAEMKIRQLDSRGHALNRERGEALARVAEVQRHLAWYAERRNYAPTRQGESAFDHLVNVDGYDGRGPGARARAALEATEEERA